MLEIIALIFLTREIGSLAKTKGLRPIAWKIYLVLGWILAEFIGVIVGVLIFGPDNIISVMLVGIIFAVTSYYILKAWLNRLPDDGIDEDISRIGQDL